MPLNERDYANLMQRMEDNHAAIMNTLQLRKSYWDERINKVCAAVAEMKEHCAKQVDNCSVVFKEYDKRIDANTNDITKIKTVGAVIAFIWGALVSLGGHFMRKI